ncbi:jg23919, partial [Pararge aegeria aegeria]
GNEENRIASENTLSLNETGNTVTDETTGTPFATPKPFRKRRRPEVEQDPTQQEAVNILQRMYESRKSRDENDAFGEYVSMKLKQIKNSNAKNTAQHHINNILYNATMGQYDFPTTFTDPTASSSWGYNSEPNLSTFSENNADCSSRGYYTAPSPSASFETSSSDNSRTHTRTSARTQSPSNLSESSQDSTQSLNDLLESIKN